MKTYSMHHSRSGHWPISLGASHGSLTGRGCRPLISGAPRRIFAFVLSFLALGSVFGAPYPLEGLQMEWVQPDGAPLTLRVFGDEFYRRTTTDDGYTVLFNPADQAYYYARIGVTGKSLVSTGVKAHRVPPQSLAKHLKEPKDIVSAIRQANIQKYVPDRAANWAARVKAVRTLRTRTAGPTATAEPSTAEFAATAALAAPISGTKVGLMILVQFPDDPATGAVDPTTFPTTQAKIDRLSNEVGYTDDGNTGSIRDYFYDQSNGLLTHTQLVTTVLTLPHPRDYYIYSDYPTNNNMITSNGITGRMLVTDAIAQLQTNGFDFSTLAVDSNNRVYAVSLLFAGGRTPLLWPHQWYLASDINVGTITIPRYIHNYQITNVPDAAPAIGTIIHELGHLLLGYPDLYDTDSSDGSSHGVGFHGLMGYGAGLNNDKSPAPIELYLKSVSGWANITDINPATSLDVSLPSTGNFGYRISKPGILTEYFLVENRGGGDKWANSCVDTGIVIWHVDEAVTTANQRQQMTPSQHYELSIEQADGQFDLEMNTNGGDTTDLFDVADNLFNDGTSPNADWWDGTSSGISIDVLSNHGPSMNVRFSPSAPTTPLVFVDPRIGHTSNGDDSDVSSTHSIDLLGATTNCTTGVGDCTYSYRITGQSSADSAIFSGADNSSASGSVIFNFNTTGAMAFDITVDVKYKGVVAVNSTWLISNPAGPAEAAPVIIDSTGLGGLGATLNGAYVPRGYSSSQLIDDSFNSTVNSVPAGPGSLTVDILGLNCASDDGNGGECIAAIGQQSSLGWLNLNGTVNPGNPLYGIFVDFTFTPIAAPDQLPPSLATTSPTNNAPVNSANVTLNGTATDAGQGDSGISSVVVNAVSATNGTATGSNTANWSYNATLTPGTNNLSIIATDGSPNANQTSNALTLNYIPFVVDTDGDGLDDSFETAIGTNPNLVDSDGDGRSDSQELGYDGDGSFYNQNTDTDPTSSDSDGDGFSDGNEISSGTDPLDPVSHPLPDGDVNGDGLVDVADLLLAMRILNGQYTPTQAEQNRWDVAPLVGGMPQPDGQNMLGDYAVLQRKVIGQINF